MHEYKVKYSYLSSKGETITHETYQARSAQEAVDRCRYHNWILIWQCMDFWIEEVYVFTDTGCSPCRENWK